MSEAFFVQMVGTNLVKCESESMSEVSFVQNGWNPRWLEFKLAETQDQNEWLWVRLNERKNKLSQNEWVNFYLCKMDESKMAEFKMAQYKMAAIISVEVRINEFESHWISWSQSFVQNGWIKDGRIQEWIAIMAAFIKIQWEWLSEIFLSRMAESKMAEFKMAAITKLSEND